MTDTIERYIPLDDLTVRADAGGRTIEAYAAVFDSPQEIRDREGHYHEIIDRTAFDRTLTQRAGQIQAIFNHGMTIHGTPSERFSMPYGVPTEIKPDTRGLWTVTEVSRTPLGDEVLELARSGAIRGMSFSGKPYTTKSEGRADDGVQIKRRMELGLREFGATPFPYYADAQIVAIRSQLELLDVDEIARFLTDMDSAMRSQLADALLSIAGPGTGADTARPDDPPSHGHVVDPITQRLLAQRVQATLSKEIPA
jgi:HK97 family phage prohead protease